MISRTTADPIKPAPPVTRIRLLITTKLRKNQVKRIQLHSYLSGVIVIYRFHKHENKVNIPPETTYEYACPKRKTAGSNIRGSGYRT
jgi:hypothetical protein